MKKNKKLNKIQQYNKIKKIIREAFDNVEEIVKKDIHISSKKIQIHGY